MKELDYKNVTDLTNIRNAIRCLEGIYTDKPYQRDCTRYLSEWRHQLEQELPEIEIED